MLQWKHISEQILEPCQNPSPGSRAWYWCHTTLKLTESSQAFSPYICSQTSSTHLELSGPPHCQVPAKNLTFRTTLRYLLCTCASTSRFPFCVCPTPVDKASLQVQVFWSALWPSTNLSTPIFTSRMRSVPASTSRMGNNLMKETQFANPWYSNGNSNRKRSSSLPINSSLSLQPTQDWLKGNSRSRVQGAWECSGLKWIQLPEIFEIFRNIYLPPS